MQTNSRKSQPEKILSTIRELEVGCVCEFSSDRTSYVQSACCRFGFEWGKKFETKINRENRTIAVTRVE